MTLLPYPELLPSEFLVPGGGYSAPLGGLGIHQIIPTLLYGPSSLGMEEAQVAAMVQIVDNLDACLTRQSDAWDPIDQAVALKLQSRYRRTKLERPPKGCVYPGVRGGVLDMPWDRFPALYVMADNATPKAESASFDQSTRAYAVSLYVEGFVRSDPFNYDDKNERIFHEGAVDRRVKRTINAIIECIEIDPTLGGAVQPLPAPAAGQTDSFTLQGQDPKDKTKKRIFASLRIAWTLDSYSVRIDAQQLVPDVLPSGLGGEWSP
jgi:hypothetical protein